jgi:hypothetical protein
VHACRTLDTTEVSGAVRPGVLRFYPMIHAINIRATCTAYQPSTRHQAIVAIPPKLSSSATQVLTRLLRSASAEPVAPLERSYACLIAWLKPEPCS